MEKQNQWLKKGYVETVLGRRLWLPEINFKFTKATSLRRAAMNAPRKELLDLIKMAMINVNEMIKENFRAK